MRRPFLLLMLFLMFKNIYGQNESRLRSFHPPVDIPIVLSGNFAEIRSDHFHSGIDIRTQGVVGKKIYSIDEGYVSRIKVQANGYGRSVYINHPGGYTSVYGHLDAYCARIDEYVKSYQYRNETHTLDIYPAKNEIRVEKGEFIAYSGNSGSSGGPHLHFEIRNSANQHPLNVLDFGFDIKDNRSPEIMSLYLYEFTGNDFRRRTSGRKKIELRKEGNLYYQASSEAIVITKPVSFGIETFDFLNGSGNRCGIYTMDVYINGDHFYSYKTNEFSFGESRFINAHTDYSLRYEQDLRVHTLYRKPNNSLSMVKYLRNNGILEPLEGLKYDVRIIITDVDSNESVLNLKLEGKPESEAGAETCGSELFRWDRNNEKADSMFRFYLPAKSLYEDSYLSFSHTNSRLNEQQRIFHIGDPSVPIHRPADLYLNISGTDEKLIEKYCILRIEKDGKKENEGGRVVGNDWLMTKIRSFGTFSIEADTTAPEIKPLNLVKNAELTGKESIDFLIRDDISGIATYKGFIDNKWVLFEYDPKNDLLYYRFDKKRLQSGQKHELELYITDERKNTSVFHSMFYW